ncbi:MAG: AI-2E family transporter [Candidatus Parcubacteria bacterium]|nr:AI-2E family transporter [Candidatus Paceibacterota bacterium]
MPLKNLFNKLQSQSGQLAIGGLDQNKPNYDVFSIGSILLIVVILAVFNFEYRTPLISGFVFATLSYPVYSWIKNRLNAINLSKIGLKKTINFDNISALLLVFGLGFLLILVLIFASGQLTREIPNLATEIYQNAKKLNDSQFIINTAKQFGFHDQLTFFNLQDRLNSTLTTSFSVDNLQKVLNTSQQILGGLITQIVYIVIFLLAWFNGLLFGSRWIDTLMSLFPLFNHEASSIKKNLVAGLRNVIYANLLAGVLNMVGVAVICLIFGIPNVLLVSLLAFIIGFLPISPSELGYAYPVIYLLYLNPILGIFAFIVAEAYILWQNYVFLPGIVLNGTNGNPLFIITSVIAGINIFGIMGFVIGPAIMIFVNTLGGILINRLHKQPSQIKLTNQ